MGKEYLAIPCPVLELPTLSADKVGGVMGFSLEVRQVLAQLWQILDKEYLAGGLEPAQGLNPGHTPLTDLLVRLRYSFVKAQWWGEYLVPFWRGGFQRHQGRARFFIQGILGFWEE